MQRVRNPKRLGVFMSTTQRLHALYHGFRSYPLSAQISLYISQGISHMMFWYKHLLCFSLCIICIAYIAITSMLDKNPDNSQSIKRTIMFVAFVIAIIMIPKLSRLKQVQQIEMIRRNKNKRPLYGIQQILRDIEFQPNDQLTNCAHHNQQGLFQLPYKNQQRDTAKEEHLVERSSKKFNLFKPFQRFSLSMQEAIQKEKVTPEQIIFILKLLANFLHKHEIRTKNLLNFLRLNKLEQQKFCKYLQNAFVWIKKLTQQMLSNLISYLNRINELFVYFKIALGPQFMKKNQVKQQDESLYQISPKEAEDLFQLLSIEYAQKKPIIRQDYDLKQLKIYKSNFHRGKVTKMSGFSNRVLQIVQKINYKSLTVLNMIRQKGTNQKTESIKRNLFILIPVFSRILQNFFLPDYNRNSDQQEYTKDRMYKIKTLQSIDDVQGAEFDALGLKADYPTDLEIIQNIVRNYLDFGLEQKDTANWQIFNWGLNKYQKPLSTIIGSDFFRRSSIANKVDLIILKNRDFQNQKYPYYEVFYEGKYLPSSSGKSSLLAAIVNFLNVVSSMGCIYKNKDFSKDIDFIFQDI